MSDMSKWQNSFARSMDNVRVHWVKRFDESVSQRVGPAFEEISAFVSKHGFRPSTPMKQGDRRSYKFELNENAYALLTFRHEGLDDMHMSCEYFVPGGDPGTYETRVSCADVTREWAGAQFQEALDSLVSALSATLSQQKDAELDLVTA